MSEDDILRNAVKKGDACSEAGMTSRGIYARNNYSTTTALTWA